MLLVFRAGEVCGSHTHTLHIKINQAAAADDDYWPINRRIIISINLMGSACAKSISN